MKKLLIASLFIGGSLYAHNPFMSCFDNGDGSVTCEAGFSDGSSGAGNAFRVVQDGKVLVDGKMTRDSEFTFLKPGGNYVAIFDAGKGHIVELSSDKIME